MRKAIADGSEPAKDGGGRRRWVRARLPESKTLGEDAPKRPPKARFLEPYRLAEDRRSALLDCLTQAGVGDAESHELFATAVEYDIASFRQSCPVPEIAPEPEPQPSGDSESRPAPRSGAAGDPAQAEPGSGPGPADAAPSAGPGRADRRPASAAVPRSALVQLAPGPDPAACDPTRALLPLAQTARILARLIVALDSPDRSALTAALQAADPFRRGYDGAYLDALCAELDRIAGIAEREAQPSPIAEPPTPPVAEPVAIPIEPPPAPPEPPLSDAGQRFVRRVARVYEQCLEIRPAAVPGNPFLAVLRVLAPEAGVRLPTDPQALARVLKDR